ncbi:hypothetical protein RFA60_000198 [Vibrio parahaemolyticus]|nr:hypothetical protein [Vibrio parahaemolyticus]
MIATHIRKHNAPTGLFSGNMLDAHISLATEKLHQANFLRVNLIKLLEKGNITQSAIADHFASSQKQISMLINNDISEFSMELLVIWSFMLDSKKGLISSRKEAEDLMLKNKIKLMERLNDRIKRKMKDDHLTQTELGLKYFEKSQPIVSYLMNVNNVQKFKYDMLRCYAYVSGITEKELDAYEK